MTASPAVLFLCLGNICRSPAAESICRARAAQAGISLYVDSAGVGAWHAGAPPDARMVAAAAARGFDMTGQEARAMRPHDYVFFDHILTADRSVHAEVLRRRPEGGDANIRLLLSYADVGISEIPDPYYGGDAGFARALNLIEAGVDGFLATLQPSKGKTATS